MSGSKNEKIIAVMPELLKLLEQTPKPLYFKYDQRDLSLYALGVGCDARRDLQFIFEGHAKFQVFPTFLAPATIEAATNFEFPSLEVDSHKIFHGEQFLEFLAPIPISGTLRCENRLVALLDKRTGASAITEVSIFDDKTNEKIGFSQIVLFISGYGNFGGPRTSSFEKPFSPIPNRQPDAIGVEKIGENQAALYRLGGMDMNPLHLDPEFAKIAGFSAPIIHGNCTMAFSIRHIINIWANNEYERLKTLRVRYCASTYPGDTILTETWREHNRIIFQTRLQSNGNVVISNAYVDLSEAEIDPKVPDYLIPNISE